MDDPKNAQADNAQIDKAGEIEDLIAELCIAAPSDDIKFCIRSYQYGRNLHQIERDINKSKKCVLKETSKFLRIPNIEHKNKTELSHLILCRIQNLLPDNCGLCNERYRIKLEEQPLLECSICGQGVHEKCLVNLLTAATSIDVETNNDKNALVRKCMNPYKLPGIFFI